MTSHRKMQRWRGWSGLGTCMHVDSRLLWHWCTVVLICAPFSASGAVGGGVCRLGEWNTGHQKTPGTGRTRIIVQRGRVGGASS